MLTHYSLPLNTPTITSYYASYFTILDMVVIGVMAMMMVMVIIMIFVRITSPLPCVLIICHIHIKGIHK